MKLESYIKELCKTKGIDIKQLQIDIDSTLYVKTIDYDDEKKEVKYVDGFIGHLDWKLKKIAKALGCSYTHLMVMAGHITESELQELSGNIEVKTPGEQALLDRLVDELCMSKLKNRLLASLC